jgi:hypothetical protein
VRTFRIQPAAAAAPLLRIQTLDVVREIQETDFEGHTSRVREHIRYRAPASVRIDRTDTAGKPLETLIQLPGIRYRTLGGEGILETGRPPEPNPVPEPLSPTIALLGRSAGPGPVVAGRRTTRIVIDDPAYLHREALVDAERSAVLDHEVTVVLEKDILGQGRERIRKHTISIRYNGPLDGGVFDVPAIPAQDGGFSRRPLAALALAPSAAPKDLKLVMSGTGPSGDAILFARGAFSILVQIGSEFPGGTSVEEIPVQVNARSATVALGLYDLPAIRFTVAGRAVTVSAPATVDGLRAIAEQMFKGRE